MSEITRETFDQVMVPNYAPAKMIPVRGEGSRVWDQNGQEYIDLVGGIAVNGLGHANSLLVEALKNQADKLWHVSNVLTNEPALEAAQKLCDLTFADKVYFCNSGAEANEAALKLARKWAFDNYGAHKNEIIATYNSFHGRTLFTVTAGGQAKYREGFEPVPGGISHVNYNDLSALEAAISDNTCAVLVEPIQGEGGVHPATEEFLEGARQLCDKYNALLIFDEIQTGVGRTGHLYAYQGYDVIPDVLTSAKALGGGFPIGAMLTTEDKAKSLGIGTHGSTYGGNPLGCAVVSKVLDEVSKPETLEQVKKTSDTIVTKLTELGEKFGLFQEIRHGGLLIGCELTDKYHGRAKDFVIEGHNQGVMLHVAGANVIRLLPALNISDAELTDAFERIEKTFAKIAKAVNG